MRNYITNEWFTVFTIIGLLAIVAAKVLNTLRFNDFLYVIGNSKYLKIYTKDQKFIDKFDSFLFINLALSLSIFTYVTYSAFVSPLPFELILFLKLLFAIRIDHNVSYVLVGISVGLLFVLGFYEIYLGQ